MKQTHWLLYESTHSDWFREITQLSNLNRAMSSMRLSLNKTQLRTNQNARRTGLLYFITEDMDYPIKLNESYERWPLVTVKSRIWNLKTK